MENEIIDLPDGSGFLILSYALPKDHWIYDSDHTPHPVLNHSYRKNIVDAVRYATRGATMNGKEMDFDPDALVQNVLYALCGSEGSSHEL